MKKYSASITLFINEFEALDRQQARQAVDAYIDHLIEITEVSDGKLAWEGVDYSIEEE
jgi:hypothetical protein